MPTYKELSDIVFVNPGSGQNYLGIEAHAPAITPPAWILLLSDYCRSHGHETMGEISIYDANIEGWQGAESAKTIIEEFAPHPLPLIVIWVAGQNPSASTQTMPIAIRIAQDLKATAPDIPIAIGGIHPSALPQRTLSETGADYIIVGEGFYAISRLAWALKAGDIPNDIPGLYCAPGVFTPAPGLNQDQLPGYAWDLLRGGLGTYRAHDWHLYQDAYKNQAPGHTDIRSPYASIYTQLGCRRSCDFCVTPGFFGPGSVRRWSPETVASWIDRLVDRYGVRNIRIEDDDFLLDHGHAEAICDLLIERGYDLNLWCYGGMRSYPARLLKKMSKAGFTWICIGIETAKGKDPYRGVQIQNTAHRCVRDIQDAGLSVLGNFMFGLPGERREDMEATLKLAVDLRCDFANFYSCMPLPGTALYEWAQREGKLPPSWDAYSQLGYVCQPMGTEHLFPAEVLRFRDQAFRDYHQHPDYLNHVQGKFGKAVAEHIRQMSGKKIRRLLE